MSDRDEVRELAEEIMGLAAQWPVGTVEDHLRAFLANQEAEQAGALASLRGALEPLKACEFPAKHRHGGGWKDNEGSPEGMLTIGEIRAIQAALAPEAGRLEAEALRAALKWEADETKARDANDDRVWGVADKSKEDLYDRLIALRAARGGEGRG